MKQLNSKNILSLAALIFGLITMFASSSVLFSYSSILAKNGNYPDFILWMNLLSSPLYLLAALGFRYAKVWTAYPLLVIFIMLFISLTYFILLIKSGGGYELDTLMALAFRIAFTSTLVFIAFNKTVKKIKS